MKWKPDWVQIGVLLISLGAFWYSVHHDEQSVHDVLTEKIARIEQRLDDTGKTLDRIEAEIWGKR